MKKKKTWNPSSNIILIFNFLNVEFLSSVDKIV